MASNSMTMTTTTTTMMIVGGCCCLLITTMLSSSCCLAFNTMMMTPNTAVTMRKPPSPRSSTTGSRLYDSYEDQYAQFYNQPVVDDAAAAAAAATTANDATANEEEAATDTNGAFAVAETAGEAEEPTPAALSYLEDMTNSAATMPITSNGGDAVVAAPAAGVFEEQSEQVYYEATNSYGAPEPEELEPEPLVVAAAEPEPEPYVVMASEAGSAVASYSDPIPQAKPFGVPPAQSDSSPTLSAIATVPEYISNSASTISVTLGVPLPKLEPGKVIPFGEASRQYRRTVYSHDDWVRHRSPDRFVKYVANIINSGVYKNVGRQVLFLTAITLFVMVYNGSVVGYQDILGLPQPALIESNFFPPLTLPLQPFTLSSSSLGLLVAFRSNTAYTRWDEARKNWGMNINHTRDLNRMANAYYDRTGVSEEKRHADLERLSWCTWAFVRSMKRHLSPESEDEAQFKAELYEKLPKSQAAKIIAAAHRPNRALHDLSLAIENLPMHFLRKNEMHRALTIFEDTLGSSERLLTSPVPLIYNRHTARFLIVWVMLLPFAMWESFGNMWNHIGLMPTMAILGVMLFGIEELATQLEEPFTVLPMQAFCDKIGNWCAEITSWEDGTNGITTNRSYQGRTRTD